MKNSARTFASHIHNINLVCVCVMNLKRSSES